MTLQTGRSPDSQKQPSIKNSSNSNNFQELKINEVSHNDDLRFDKKLFTFFCVGGKMAPKWSRDKKSAFSSRIQWQTQNLKNVKISVSKIGKTIFEVFLNPKFSMKFSLLKQGSKTGFLHKKTRKKLCADTWATVEFSR